MPPAPTPKIIPHARAYRKQNSNIGYKSAPHAFAPKNQPRVYADIPLCPNALRTHLRPQRAETYADLTPPPKAIRTHLRPQVYTRKKSRFLTVIPTSARSRPQDHIRKELSRMRRSAREDASFSSLLICTYVHNTNRVISQSTYRVPRFPSRFPQNNAAPRQRLPREW